MAEVFDVKPNKIFVAEMVLESATTDIPGVSAEGGTHSFRKYSLRPRSSPKRQNSQPGTKVRGKSGRPKSTSTSKAKPKPALLSKYRRKNANARERFRMKAINDGFEALRRAIPFQPEEAPSDSKKLTMTKITTLKLAIQYIRALAKLLEDHDAGRLDVAALQSSLLSTNSDEDNERLFAEFCSNLDVDLSEFINSSRPATKRSNDTSSDASSSGFCSDDNNPILEDFLDPFDPFSPFPGASDPRALDALFSPIAGDFGLDDFCDP